MTTDNIVNTNEFVYDDDEYVKITNKDYIANGFKFSVGLNKSKKTKSEWFTFCKVKDLGKLLQHFYIENINVKSGLLGVLGKLPLDKDVNIWRVSLPEGEMVIEDECLKARNLILSNCAPLLGNEKLCELVVQKWGRMISHVPFKKQKMIELALQQDGSLLQYVKPQTERLCELAVQSDGCALKHVKIPQTERMCELAIRQTYIALEFVHNQTEQLCELAIRQNCYAFYYLRNQTELLCELAMQNCGELLQWVDIPQTERMCELAVQNDGCALKHVKIPQTERMCELAVQQYPYALKYVKNQTDKICELAVVQDWAVLNLVKNQTVKLCLIAAKQDLNAWQIMRDTRLRSMFHESNFRKYGGLDGIDY